MDVMAEVMLYPVMRLLDKETNNIYYPENREEFFNILQQLAHLPKKYSR